MASTLAPPTLEASQQVTDTMRPALAYMKRRDEGEHAAACYYQRRAAARYANASELVANCSE